uniref:Uncharacterized protein n=1 Tax=Gopherus evgoodei TaxID=1825980 RepID=A0A8C4W6V4_9SAUR
MSRILQEFGVFQNPLELKTLVQEITGNTGSTVPYKDFTMVMLGRRSTIGAIGCSAAISNLPVAAVSGH